MAQTHRQFFDSIASQWNEMAPAQDFLTQLVRRLQLPPAASVLDVGAGTGQLALVLSHGPERPARVYVLDSAPKMLSYARQKQYGCPTSFVLADALFLPLKTNEVNHVICFEVLPHLGEPVTALREFYRVLGSEGKITIAHQSGSEQVNAVHSRIGEPVARDFLPQAIAMAQLLTLVGWQVLTAEESESIYFVQAQKIT